MTCYMLHVLRMSGLGAQLRLAQLQSAAQMKRTGAEWRGLVHLAGAPAYLRAHALRTECVAMIRVRMHCWKGAGTWQQSGAFC